MIRNLICIFAGLLLAFVFTAIVRTCRQRGKEPDWWNAEGTPIFIMAFFVIVSCLVM